MRVLPALLWLLLGCASTSTPEPSHREAACPADAPSSGGACTLADGTRCVFAGCLSPVATCNAGHWTVETHPSPTCSIPDAGDAE